MSRSIIPEVKAVRQLKQYYQMIKDAQDSMKGGGKRKKGGTRHKNLGIKINELQKQIYNLERRVFKDTRSGKHKNLGKKINELQNSIYRLGKGNERLMRKIHDNSQEINDAYANIQSNEQSIGLINSYINYKLDETHKPSHNDSIKPPLEVWTQHLNSIYNRRDRNAHDEQILRNAEMLGGRRKKTRKRRRKKTKRKRRRRNKKTRRKKSRK
tara:strand:- start:787 stop:1422 length:636 start_codon:yes stop_codon:yes gene_type:complete